MSIHVALLGDSTLDNVIWMNKDADAQALCVTGQLQRELDAADTVHNLAADGFTTTDMLKGAAPALSYGIRKTLGDPLPVASARSVFKPLEHLAACHATHAVLSVGGNDIRIILSDMRQLGEASAVFASNYPRIVESIVQSVPALVLVLQYRPARDMDFEGYGVYTAMSTLPGAGGPVAKMNALMERMYVPILALARARRLPVVDLPSSFDIHDRDLYSHQIEPSASGSQLIAKLIAHVLRNHAFDGESQIYSLPPEDWRTAAVIARPNTGELTLAYDAERDDRAGPDFSGSAFGAQLAALQIMGFDVSDPRVTGVLHETGGDVEATVARLLDGQ